MKRLFSLVFLTLIIISLIGNISSSPACFKDLGYVNGTIYDSSNNVVADADINVTWINNGTSYSKETTSNTDGEYYVGFECNCHEGDIVNVYASKESLYGSASGTLTNDESFDVLVLDIPLVPEFGVVIGILTVFGAVGIFFFVRKN